MVYVIHTTIMKVRLTIPQDMLAEADLFSGQWSNQLRDTDAGLQMVYESCVEAGPESCALHAPNAAGVKARADTIFTKLKTGPLPVLPAKNATSALEYGLVDYVMVRSLVFQFLYSPYDKKGMNAAIVASALAAIEHGDGRPLWDLASAYRTKDFKCDCDKDRDFKPPRYTKVSNLAITCSDADAVEDNVAGLQAHYENMAKMSSFAELFDVRVNCACVRVYNTRLRY
jgi:hypothetical protein